MKRDENSLVPFDSLDILGLIASAGGEAVGEDQTSEGITLLVGTVGVHLTTVVTLL